MSAKKFKSRDLILPSCGIQFAEVEQVDEVTKARFSLVARTNTPIDTWMGQLIHDLHGMFHKDPVNLDWRHNCDESIGYLDRFEVSNEKIVCYGAIVSVEPGDRASRIIKQAMAGIPFEASIYFGGQGIKVEEIPVDKKADVNGQEFNGPGIIFREWPMRGVAVCPYGADNSTSTSFNFEDGDIEYSALILEKKETSVSNQTNDTDDQKLALEKKKADEAKLKAEAEAAAIAAESKKLDESRKNDNSPSKAPVSPDGLSGADFISAFGENGAVWFAEGKTFSESMVCHYKKLETTVKDLTEQLEALKKDAGSSTSVNFDDDDDDADGKRKKNVAKKTKELENKIGPNLAAFAANLIIKR